MEFFALNPLVSVGKIKIGASRTEVRNAMGEYTEFKKTKYSKNTTDDFGSCHVFYNPENNVDAVEIFRGSVVEYKKKNLFLLNHDSLVSLFSDYNPRIEQGTLSFPEIGLEIVFEGEEVDSVLVSRLGY